MTATVRESGRTRLEPHGASALVEVRRAADKADPLMLRAEGRRRRLRFVERPKPQQPERVHGTVHQDLNAGLLNLRGPSEMDSYKPPRHFHLFVSQRACEDLYAHIQWGTNCPSNAIEQGGVLVGRVLHYVDSSLCVGLVERVMPARNAEGSAVHLHMSHEDWSEILDSIDEIGDADACQIIGWYHTHPGDLEVFMSRTDEATQSQLFSEDWAFALVLNPQRKEFRVYHGRHSEECSGNLEGPDRRSTQLVPTKDRAQEAAESSLPVRRGDEVSTPPIGGAAAAAPEPLWQRVLAFVERLRPVLRKEETESGVAPTADSPVSASQAEPAIPDWVELRSGGFASASLEPNDRVAADILVRSDFPLHTTGRSEGGFVEVELPPRAWLSAKHLWCEPHDAESP